MTDHLCARTRFAGRLNLGARGDISPPARSPNRWEFAEKARPARISIVQIEALRIAPARTRSADCHAPLYIQPDNWARAPNELGMPAK